jgi:hypothetical protein
VSKYVQSGGTSWTRGGSIMAREQVLVSESRTVKLGAGGLADLLGCDRRGERR